MKIIRKIISNFDSPGEVLLFLRILFFVTLLPVLIKLLTVPGLMRILTPIDGKAGKEKGLNERKDKIKKYVDYILGKNFWIYRNICLKRALVLYRFLRNEGIDVHICFGVRYADAAAGTTTGKKLEGHAWLVSKGEIYLEANPEETKTYKMTYCYPGLNKQAVPEGFKADTEGVR